MAKEDYTVADRDLTANGGALTARDKVNVNTFANPDVDAKEFAADNDVSQSQFVNYSEALTAHEQREDIETLADRRAREYGTTFDAGAFMRATPTDEAPTPGTVNGVAPASE